MRDGGETLRDCSTVSGTIGRFVGFGTFTELGGVDADDLQPLGLRER